MYRHNSYYPVHSMCQLYLDYRYEVGDAYEGPVPSYVLDQCRPWEEGSRYKLERNMPYERPHAQFRTSLYEGTAFDHSSSNLNNFSSNCYQVGNQSNVANAVRSSKIQEAKEHVDTAANLLRYY
ncbi:hypothetical protein M9Y10_001289 [Tritrichomonas musculus]|uniref:Uncharacterized protein n=1 Tax=Tritrichomonas musculus TaxID=1915356 RepID=A0ABR2L6P1_9EUKA